MTQITNRIAIQQFRTTILSIRDHSYQNSKLRFISPDKWKKLMLKSIQLISEYSYSDKDLIHDLNIIINNISEDKFVQAILSFQPFKPKFKQIKFLDLDSTTTSTIKQQSSLNYSNYKYQTPKTKLKKDQSIIQKGSIILKKKSMNKQQKTCQTIKMIEQQKQVYQLSSPSNKDSFFLKQYLQVIIQQQALKKQFQKKYHPFKKIIDSFTFIIQNKYKNIIDSCKKIKLEKIQQLITYDLLVLEKFFIKISQPYQSIFNSENPEEVKLFKKKMFMFIKDYIKTHEKLTAAIRKIMRHFARKSKIIKKLQQNIQDFIEINNFNIHNDFKIDGSYVQSMNCLMQLVQISKPGDILLKLQQFRLTIAKDVDFYYQSLGQNKQRQINAQVQIQIIRFIVCKLKGWIPQIFAQLKYLQIIYGDQQMAYKYDDSSYIYAQLITIFDALQIQCSIQPSNSDSKSIISSIKD